MTVQILGLLGVPIGIALVTAVIGIVRGIIKFTNYMVRTEAAQLTNEHALVGIEKTNREVKDQLTRLVELIDLRVDDHERRITILEISLLGRSTRSNPNDKK